MNRYSRLSHFVAIGSAATFGWFFGQLQSKDYINILKEVTFPTLETVLAATNVVTGNVPAEQPEIISEPSTKTPRVSQIMRFGFPSLTNIRSLNNYVLSYDSRNRVPYWVFEHLTAENIAKNETVSRTNCEFHEDLSLHEFFRSRNSDYKSSGFDRGHLAAAGNHRKSQEDCEQTFLLSNMAPQVGRGFNRDKWNELEMYTRKLTKEFKNVYICTGPLYLPRREEDGKLYVKYQVIGQNHVAVPTHFYKVIVCERNSGELELESFVLPNQRIDDSVSLIAFHTSPEIIERASGLLFFDKINRKKLSKINGKKLGWF